MRLEDEICIFASTVKKKVTGIKVILLNSFGISYVWISKKLAVCETLFEILNPFHNCLEILNPFLM
jgi:hypothetical protein